MEPIFRETKFVDQVRSVLVLVARLQGVYYLLAWLGFKWKQCLEERNYVTGSGESVHILSVARFQGMYCLLT